MIYKIFNEYDEWMRVSTNYAYAKQIIGLRKGWYIKKIKPNPIQFEESPF